MLLKDFIAEGVASLRDLYPEEEARSLVLMLCAAKLGVQRYTHLIEPQTEIPPGREEELSDAMERLRDAEPVQYVTGVASFCGHDFRVTRDVLIPRPETECLVREACEAAEALARMKTAAGRAGEPLRILDLCTGSGCIAWSLSLALPGARVTGVDVSEAALEVARGQAFGRELRRLGARAPEFIRQDILEADITVLGMAQKRLVLPVAAAVVQHGVVHKTSGVQPAVGKGVAVVFEVLAEFRFCGVRQPGGEALQNLMRGQLFRQQDAKIINMPKRDVGGFKWRHTQRNADDVRAHGVKGVGFRINSDECSGADFLQPVFKSIPVLDGAVLCLAVFWSLCGQRVGSIRALGE